MQNVVKLVPKVAQGKWIDVIFDVINLVFFKKGVSFEKAFRDSIEKSFTVHKRHLIEEALRGRRISRERSNEYEGYKLDVDSLIKKIKQKSQWNDISRLAFIEDQSFEEILHNHIKEFLGILEDLMPDSSDDSTRQLAINISKQLKNEFKTIIESEQTLFNSCLMEKLNLNDLINSNIEEILEEIKECLEYLGITKLHIDSISSMLKEFMKKNSEEHKEILTSIQNRNFTDFLSELEKKLVSKDWPDFLKCIVLKNIHDILKEFRDMGEKETCNFLKTVLLEFFFYNNKSMKLENYMESTAKIVECIALIKIVYPKLTLGTKTAKSLDIDECRSICLLYTDYKYRKTIVELWKYINEYQPELKGVFRVIVGNQICRFCNEKKGADLKTLGLDNYLPDFMKVMLTDGSKPEYNNLQVTFKEIAFHCQECLESYEDDDMNCNKYKNTLYSIFEEEGMMIHE